MDNNGTDILIIDTYNMIVRSKNKWTKVADSNLIISLFLKTLKNTIEQFKPSKVIMPLDDYIGNSFRKKIIPEYKSQRVAKNEKDPFYEDFKKQKSKILKLIETSLPVYTLKYKGYEADDLIAIICKTISDNVNVVIWSNDCDLIQIQQKYPNVKVWNPKAKSFFASPKYNIALYKSLVGDKSDNVPGVKGIGVKNALQALGSTVEFIRIIGSKPERYIEYRNNLKVIDLFNNELDVPYNLIHILEEKVKFEQADFTNMVKKNKLRETLNNIDQYNNCFNQLVEKNNNLNQNIFFNRKQGEKECLKA